MLPGICLAARSGVLPPPERGRVGEGVDVPHDPHPPRFVRRPPPLGGGDERAPRGRIHDLPYAARRPRLGRDLRRVRARVAPRGARHGECAADGSGIRQADGDHGDARQVRDAWPARCRREAVGASQAPVLRQRPERQGSRHPARLLDRARRRGLSARRAGRDPDRIPHRHVAAGEPRARSVHPGAQADLATRLDAARALHHQGLPRSRRSSSSSSVRSGRC